MHQKQGMKFASPKPYPPTPLEELDPRACLNFTVEGARREIAKINSECVALSREIKPAQAFLRSAFRRLAALNKQRHTLDFFIFEDKLRKVPRGFAGLPVGHAIRTPEDFKDWVATLEPAELEAFRLYLEEGRS